MPIFKKLQSIYDKIDLATGQNLEVDKPYLLLLVPADSPEQDFTAGEWVALKGRKEVYDYIMNYVANGNYILLKSFILSGGITFGNEVSIYTFARLCIEKYNYGSQEDLETLNNMATDTAIVGNDPLTDEELGRFYAQELTQKTK